MDFTSYIVSAIAKTRITTFMHVIIYFDLFFDLNNISPSNSKSALLLWFKKKGNKLFYISIIVPIAKYACTTPDRIIYITYYDNYSSNEHKKSRYTKRQRVTGIVSKTLNILKISHKFLLTFHYWQS